jgi:hypothetical protein
MILLIAFLTVMPPITLGEFGTREGCEEVRKALIRDGIYEPAMLQIVCLGPDIDSERRRFEFRPD